MSTNDFSLAKALTERTQADCIGIESGSAPILSKVSSTTAELLKWWFQQEFCDARPFNFHAGQRQAILNAIYAHEVLQASTLLDLYGEVAPEELLDAGFLDEVSQSKHQHPKYCCKLATGTGKTWILQALIIWQALNKIDAPTNLRFTNNFLIVAPGLIVYDRLLDAFMGKEQEGVRNFSTSDIANFQSLFVPDTRKDEVFQFVQNAVCSKEDIGKRPTGTGLIAVTNWHLLAEAEDVQDIVEETVISLSSLANPKAVIDSIFPVLPGKSAGNALDVLDRNFIRGNVIDFLRNLPDLMVCNDEAHHIHAVQKAGEVTEVEWQRSLTRIAETKGERFIQIDFSATPFNQVGAGVKAKRIYFPHIIVDFDLKQAMRMGLVKSLVLDKRRSIGALPLEFKSELGLDGKPTLSDGQRIMLRAGLAKLRKLETDFSALDPNRYPKMMVVCEDTTISPLVVDFFKSEGLPDDDVMSIDSGMKGELKPDEWAKVRERLFDVDRHKTPRIIVSVLMLREGFDVSNICVIVPLRTTGAQILLEQTIGRGLRLMWRESEYSDIKRENRERINQGLEPKSMIDILSIVEHPAFQAFYDDLMNEGLVGQISDSSDSANSNGDVISIGLRDGFEPLDFAIPFILREADENLSQTHINCMTLIPFSAISIQQLKRMTGKGDVFTSKDVQAGTMFGDYRVEGGIMTAVGYNDFVSRMTNRIAQALSAPITKSAAALNRSGFPYIQVNLAMLAGWVDQYIRNHLFNTPFDPLADENWRVLLLDVVAQHIIKVMANALISSESQSIDGDPEIAWRKVSEVKKLAMREGSSIDVRKCIYTRLPFPPRSGGLEKSFIEFADADGNIESFCKINEQKHDFLRLRYLKEDGLPGFYSPDFLVRSKDFVWLVETKAQGQLAHPDVQRKMRAAVAWCDRINSLAPEFRNFREWYYVLLGEEAFWEWKNNGGRMNDMLDMARLRPANHLQQPLDL